MASLLHFGPKNKRSPLVTPGNKMRVLQFPASVVSLVNKKQIYKTCCRSFLFYFLFFSFFKSRCPVPHSYSAILLPSSFSLMPFFVCFSSRVKPLTHTAKYETVTFCLTRGLKCFFSQKSKNMQKNSCGSPQLRWGRRKIIFVQGGFGVVTAQKTKRAVAFWPIKTIIIPTSHTSSQSF